MKEGWELKKIKEVADVFAGQGAPQGDSNYCLNGIPFVKAGNLSELINGKPESSIQNVSEQVAKTHKLKLYKAGSVLFAKSGMSCMKGYVYTLKKDCYVVSHLAIITPISVDSHFLNYYLCFNKPNTLIKDSAYPSISLKDIENLKIPVPTISEQQQIVEELDLLSSIIEKKREQLKELDNLAQSIFYDMFGDPVTNEKGWELKEIQSLFKVTSSKRILQSEWQNNGIPFYRVADIVNIINGINVVPSTFIKESTFSDLEKGGFVPSSGDILITSRGTLGQCYIVGQKDRFYFQDGMITWISPKNSYTNPIFVKSVFAINSFADSLTQSANSSTVAYISISQLSKKKLICPPLPLQQQFASKIEAIEQQKELIKQSITEVETLFNSRMDYYFN
jgi:type I restriction enzyme S subunit